VVAAILLVWPRVARSQEAPAPPPTTPPATPSPAPAEPAVEPAEASAGGTVDLIEGVRPPPTNIVYFQYGVAIAAEIVSSAGAICDNPRVPCILGPGGGIAVRFGFRGAGPIYLGFAYEMSKQDPSKLYRFALLQQARAEGRYYLMTARVTEPYAAVSVGVAGYGNEWSVDSWGPGGSLGIGVEYQVTQRTVIGVAANYRGYYFSSFTDTSGAPRDGGVGQLVGLDVVLEQRDPSLVAQKPAAPRD
jgi:hypothetical protein